MIDWRASSITWDQCFSEPPQLTAELSGHVMCKHVISYDDIFKDLERKLRGFLMPEVKRVIFNNPATIIYWNDNTKTVVKCQNGEPFDAEKGFALCYLKKLLGNDNTFNKVIKKWVGET